MSPSTRTFLSVVDELNFLSREDMETLSTELSGSDLPGPELAVRKGLLTPTQVDIASTLMDPDAAIPSYRILGLLGYGGMGVVYKAKQLNLDRVVALKTVQVSRMVGKGALSRFEQEALTVARLQHPNIVAAYDFGHHDERYYFAMEFVQGEDLSSRIERSGPLGEHFAWRLARQAAVGLAHAAESGIIHRDIKPANLLLVQAPVSYGGTTDEAMVKIADFGLAFLVQDVEATDPDDISTRITAEHVMLGTPHYLAPDQIEDGQSFDEATDIYSLGATVYHMLTGEPPFKGKNLTDIIARKVRGDLMSLAELRPDLSEASTSLVADMMQHDRNARLADYRTLLARIDQVLAGAPPPSEDARQPAASAAATVDQPAGSKTRSAWARGGVAVLLLLVALGILATWRPRTGDGGGVGQLDAVRATMKSTGWGAPLFDGQSIDDWIITNGSWAPTRHEQLGWLLAGSGGVSRRGLFRQRDGASVPIALYRLQLVVHMNKANAVELHFGVLSTEDRDGPRYVLRLDDTGATIGRQIGNRGDFKPAGAPTNLDLSDPMKPHVIELRRHPDLWYALVDDKLVGGATMEPGQLPEFRLRVEGGPAWFSDIIVTELEPVAPSK